MSEAFQEFQAELETLRTKHGIETYLFIAKSPFDSNVATHFGGDSGWIAGHASFTLDLMNKRWNADRT